MKRALVVTIPFALSAAFAGWVIFTAVHDTGEGRSLGEAVAAQPTLDPGRLPPVDDTVSKLDVAEQDRLRAEYNTPALLSARLAAALGAFRASGKSLRDLPVEPTTAGGWPEPENLQAGVRFVDVVARGVVTGIAFADNGDALMDIRLSDVYFGGPSAQQTLTIQVPYTFLHQPSVRAGCEEWLALGIPDFFPVAFEGDEVLVMAYLEKDLARGPGYLPALPHGFARIVDGKLVSTWPVFAGQPIEEIEMKLRSLEAR